jgi:hypothetical protein
MALLGLLVVYFVVKATVKRIKAKG